MDPYAKIRKHYGHPKAPYVFRVHGEKLDCSGKLK